MRLVAKHARGLALAALACAAAAAPLPAAISGRLEAPRHAVAGDRVPLRIVLVDEAGAPPDRPIPFELAATGRARFGTAARSGVLQFGGGSPFIGCETAADGTFEIDLDVPAVEEVDLLFQTREPDVSSVLQVAFEDGMESARPRWSQATLAGSLSSWRLVEHPGLPGRRAWWAGSESDSRDAALISVPLEIPDRRDAVLRLTHAYDLESPGCAAEGSHRGACIEATEGGLSWLPLEPGEGYPASLADACHGLAAGRGVFGGSTEGRFVTHSFDLRALAGKTVRLRLRLSTGCGACPPGAGWFLERVRIERGLLRIGVLPPDEDLDGDGLSNASERSRGSDPRLPDTDGDGLGDRAEDGSGVFRGEDAPGSDPLSPDTDGGGVPDGAEAALGSDPNDAGREPERVAFPIALPSGAAVDWSLRADGSLGPSSPDPLRDVFAPGGGFRLEVGLSYFAGAGEGFRAGPGGDEILLGPVRLGPIRVTRRIGAEGGVLRWLDTFENAGEDPAPGQAVFEIPFAQKAWVEVESTSSGDAMWTPGDDGVHFNDRDPEDGMPYLLWLHGGPGALARPEGQSLRGGLASLAFQLDLEPGERKSILHMASLDASLAANRERAAALGASVVSGAGIRPGDEDLIINFGIDRDGDGMSGRFERAAGLDPLDPSDAAGDLDGDGLSNLEEHDARTDPRLADTDGDGLTDRGEQLEGSDPRIADTDGDGVADGRDPYPLTRVLARLELPSHALVGEGASVAVEVLAGEVPAGGLRFGLAVEGSGASFEAPVSEGTVLGGIGSGEVRIEASAAGRVGLTLRSTAPGVKQIRVLDPEQRGVAFLTGTREDFEATDGGFEPIDTGFLWAWGEPPAPPGAASGAKVWGTGIGGAPGPGAIFLLDTPEYVLTGGTEPVLEIASSIRGGLEEEFAAIGISVDGGQFEILHGPFDPSGDGYLRETIDLSEFSGKKVRFELFHAVDEAGSSRGWFIDDFEVKGIGSRDSLEFITGDGDRDGDGLDDRAEVLRGSDPTRADTDGDGLRDPVETGTGRFVGPEDTGTDPAHPDTDRGGETDGDEVQGGRDPHSASDDEVPLTEFFLHVVDGGGLAWDLFSDASALFVGGDPESTGLAFLLDEIESSGVPFFAEESRAGLSGRMLIAEGSFGFEEESDVTRKVFVSRERPLLRWFDAFDAPPGAARDLSLDVPSRAFPDPRVEVVQTGSGDLAIGPEDDWYILRLDLAGRTFFLGRILAGPGGAVRPIPRESRPVDGTQYSLSVPARGRAGLLRFVSLSPSLDSVAAALDEARRLTPAALEGLSFAERAAAVNFRIDSDRDGMSDAFEVARGLDPANGADAAADPDGDGLSNADEERAGTDPKAADTDGDGLGDAEESSLGTDPAARDSDGDGIPDGEDALPLRRIVARLSPETFAIAGEEARWRVALETDDGEPFDPAADGGRSVIAAVRFDPPLDVRSLEGGEIAGTEGGGAHLVRVTAPLLDFYVASAGRASVTATLEDRSRHGLSGSPGSAKLGFLPGEEDDDRDGLPNAFEINRGQSPVSGDSDGDRFQDKFETGSGVSFPPLDLGTFPWTADSDGGGTPDEAEIRARLDPTRGSDDLAPSELPVDIRGRSGAWRVLGSWTLTGTPEEMRIDNGAALSINGSYPASTTALAGLSTVRLGPVLTGGLEVSRIMHVHPVEPVLGIVDIFRNPGAAALDAVVEIVLDFGADAAKVAGTSSGDARLDAADRWVLVEEGLRHMLHVFHGGPSLRMAAMENDLLRERFTFPVGPGETRTLFHYIGTGNRQGLEALARGLLAGERGALDGPGAEHAGSAVNLPRWRASVTDVWPRGPVAPGEIWSVSGRFPRRDVVVTAGGVALEPVLVSAGRVALRAPAIPGDHAIEVLAGGERIHAGALSIEVGEGRFRRGDVDGDGVVILTDAIRILGHLFRSESAPRCLDAADTDDSGAVDITDAIFLLQILFQGLGPLSYPGGATPGPDAGIDELPCE